VAVVHVVRSLALVPNQPRLDSSFQGNLPTWDRSHDLYCVLSRDLDIRQTGVAKRTSVYPEWDQEVVQFPLFVDDPTECGIPGPSINERDFKGGRSLYVSCGTDEDGIIGMALVKLNGVFRSRTLSGMSRHAKFLHPLTHSLPFVGWYTLNKNSQRTGSIKLEMSITVCSALKIFGLF
jgi:hypothetical protein